MLSVMSRRQALKFSLDTEVVVIIQINNEISFEVLHRVEFLQIKKFTLEQTEEVFYDGMIQTVLFRLMLCRMPFFWSIR
jgi:hypothetical protein